jgi:hypothetical protein
VQNKKDSSAAWNKVADNPLLAKMIVEAMAKANGEPPKKQEQSKKEQQPLKYPTKMELCGTGPTPVYKCQNDITSSDQSMPVFSSKWHKQAVELILNADTQTAKDVIEFLVDRDAE